MGFAVVGIAEFANALRISEARFQYRMTSDDGTELNWENPAYDDVTLFHLVEGATGPWFGEVCGRPVIEDGGANTWAEDGPHRYVTLQPGVEGKLAQW